MWEHVGTLVTLAAFALNAGVTIAGVAWRLSRIETNLMVAIADERKEIDAEFDRARKEAGEMGHALREKIREVELFARDTFMRRDSFYKVQEEIKAEMKALGDKLEARLERMEDKLDSKT